MYFTAFFPIFLALAFYALFSGSHWVRAVIITSIFQAASPLLLGVGGRVIGFAPAYALLPIGLLHLLPYIFNSISPRAERPAIPISTWLLAAFTVYSIGAAILFPRLFQSVVMVLPPREGLDSAFPEPLRPGSGNQIQAFYLLLNLLLVISVSTIVKHSKEHWTSYLRSAKLAFLLIATLGIYQIFAFSAGLPWPATVVNSNLGIGQQPDQTIFGIKRISATFQEPSMLAMHLLGFLAFFLTRPASRLYATSTLILIGLTTSSIGYIGATIILGLSVLRDIKNGSWRFLGLALLSVFFVLGLLVVDENLLNGQLSDKLIFNKITSQSGSDRLFADAVALESLVGSYGLGVGVGSTRASSFVTSLLATCGILGALLLATAVLNAVMKSLREPRSACRPFSAGVLGLLLGASLGVPDLTFPLIWIMLAISIGSSTAEIAKPLSRRAPA